MGTTEQITTVQKLCYSYVCSLSNMLEMTVSAAEMAEPIEVLFGVCTQ